MVSVSAGAGGSNAITGVINTLVVRNTVKATSREHVTISVKKAAGSSTNDTDPLPGVYIEAHDDTELLNLAGALSAAGSVGVGATVVALVFNKNVTAETAKEHKILAPGKVQVIADAKDNLWLLAVNFAAGGSVGVAGGANALVFQNYVTSALGGTTGDINNPVQSVKVSANSDSSLYNLAAAAGIGGTAGVTAVAVITYFYNETLAYVKENSRIYAAGAVDILADSKEFVTADAAGAAGSGTVSVGGTLDVVVTKVVTKAYTEKNVLIHAKGTTADISVKADDDYKLIAVVGTISASGVAAVAVSVLTTVSYNTVSAEIGEGNTINAGRDIIIQAKSDRLVQGYVFTAGAGQAGVSGSVMVIVAGSLLTDDAHNAIYVTNNKDGKEYGSMNPQTQTDAVFAQAHKEALSSKPEDNLDDLLKGDGSSAENTANGNGALDYDKYGQDTSKKDHDESSSSNMDDKAYDSAADTIRKEGTKGAVVNGTELKDSTTAVVRGGTEGTTLTAGRNVEVVSGDSLSAYMASGTLAAGLYAGVGAGVSVAVLYSNVQAVVEDNVIISAGKDVIVKAVSGSSEQTKAELKYDAAKGTDGSKVLNDKVKESDPDNAAATGDKSTILVIGVTGSGGIAGVSVTVASLNLMNKTYARMAGNIVKAENVTVTAETQYGTVLTITLAAAGGIAGVSGSVAVTDFESKTEASISGRAKLENISGTIKVSTDGTTNATAAATAASAGAVGASTTTAVAVNRSRFDAFIGQGVSINAPSAKIDMKGYLKADAKAIIVSAAGGLAGVGVSVAVAVNRPVSMTYIGITPNGDIIETSKSDVRGQITVSSADVRNTVDGSTKVTSLGLAAGGVAVNGAVALGFNRAKSYAAVNKANVTATGDLTVEAAMNGNTTVYITSVVAGSVAVGASVAVAQIKSENIALIDVTGGTVKAANISVLAGTEANPYDTEALATVITGAAGGTAVALNFAVALNSSVNRAQAGGTSGSLIAEKELKVRADGRTKAYGIVLNAAVAGIAANVSMAWATLSSIQEALLDGNISVSAGSLTVESVQNNSETTKRKDPVTVVIDTAKKFTKTITPDSMAQAFIFSASAAAVSITANAAVATADAVSRAKVDVNNLRVSGNIKVNNKADSVATVTVNNLDPVSFISAGLMTGYAYAKGTFESILSGNGIVRADGNVDVTNTWKGNSEVKLVPASGGIAVAYYKAGVNVAIAETSTKAYAYISGKLNISAKGNVNVKVTGNADSGARIDGAVIEISKVAVAVNVVTSEVKAEQKAYIEGAGKNSAGYTGIVSENGSITVESVLNVNASGVIGGNSAKKGISVSGINGKASSATAKAESVNIAYVNNGVLEAARGKASISANTSSKTDAQALAPNFSLSLAEMNIVNVYTDSNDSVEAYVTGASRVSALKVDILANGTAEVTATGAVPGVTVSLVNGNAVIVTATAAKGTNGKVTKAYVGRDSEVYANGVTENENTVHSLKVSAESNLTITAKVPETKSIGALKLGVFLVKTIAGKTDTWAAILGKAESTNDIFVLATDKITETSNVELFSAGLVAGGASRAENTVESQNSSVQIGDGAVLKAWGNIQAQAVTKTNAQTQIQDAAYGGGTNCSVESKNNITRKTSLVIGNNVNITSVIGNIELLAEEDKTSHIESIATGSSGSVYAGGGPKAEINYNSTVTATVGNGGNIDARYGTLDIKAIANTDLYADAYRKAAAAAGSNKSEANINSNVTVVTNISKNGAKTRILGEVTTIGAYIENQVILAKAKSYTASAGSKTEAYATSNVNNNVSTGVDNAWIGGTENLNVEALVVAQNIRSESYAEVVGFTGHVYATSTVTGGNNVNVNVTSNAELAGKNISVRADAPELTTQVISRSATAVANTVVNYVWTKVKTVVTKIINKICKIPLIGKLIKKIVKKVVEWVDKLVEVILYSDAEAKEAGEFKNAGNIIFNGTVHVGGGAAGMFVDIFDGLIAYTGLDNDLTDSLKKPDKFLETDGNTITVKKLYNNDVGSLRLEAGVGNISGKGTVITNSYLPNVQITNHTDKNLILKNIQMSNSNALAPDIDTSAEGNDGFSYQVSEDTPNLIIRTEGKGNITFADGSSEADGKGSIETDLGEGVLTIEMNGGTLKTSGKAFVVANKLYISGAGKIGDGVKNPFRAYIFDISSYPGISGMVSAKPASPNEVKVKAGGDIYLSLTLVREWMTQKQMNDAKKGIGEKAALNLKEIIGGQNSTVYVSVEAPKVVCAGKPDSADDYFISVPRTAMDFVTLPGAKGKTFQKVQLKDANGNNTDFWLTDDGMLVNMSEDITFVSDAYLVSQTSKYDTYLLPNGATVVVDRVSKKLVRIIGRLHDEKSEDYSGGIYDLSNMKVETDSNGNLTITINENGNTFNQKITFRNGTAYMEIGQNGATTYIESSGLEEGLGWRLPNGIVVFYKQVFLDERTNTVVNGTPIMETKDGRWILLESITEAGRTKYHVVHVTGTDGHYEFKEGYIYDRADLEAKTISLNQSLKEAKKAVKNALGNKNAITSMVETALKGAGVQTELSGYADAIRNAIMAKLKGKVTPNIIVDVLVTLSKTTKTEKYNYTGETLEYTTYNTPWKFVVSLKTNNGDKEVSETVYNEKGSVSEKINAGSSDKALEIGSEVTSSTAGNSQNGTKAADSYTVYQESADSDIYYRYDDDTKTWTINVKGKDLLGNDYWFTFDLKQTNGEWYQAEEGIWLLKRHAAYETVKNLFIRILSAPVTVLKNQTKGGYKTTDKTVTFLDNDGDEKGILLITDRVLALFPDGTYSFVAVRKDENATDTGSTPGMNETVAIAPGMQQKKDENGDLVYSRVFLSLQKNDGSGSWLTGDDVTAAFSSTLAGMIRSHIQNGVVILNPQVDKDLIAAINEELSGRYDISLISYYTMAGGKKHYAYDTSSDRVYVLETDVTDAEGRKRYRVDGFTDGSLYYRKKSGLFIGASDDIGTVEVVNGYVYLTDEEAERLARGAYTSKRDARFETRVNRSISFTKVTGYIPGTIIISPIEKSDTDSSNSAYLYFKNATEQFAASRDSNGYAIIDRYLRVVDKAMENASGLPIGTILFLDESGQIAAYLKPDGTFRVYEISSGKSENGSTQYVEVTKDGTTERAYSEYTVDSNGKLNTTISKGTATYLMELSQDVYTSIYGLHQDPPADSLYNYDSAHYFGYSEDGTLVELTKTDEKYKYVGADGDYLLARDDANGTEKGFGLSNGKQKLLSILNNTVKHPLSVRNNKAIYIMTDNSTIDSDGNLSSLTADTARIYADLEDDTDLILGKVEGGEVIIEITSPKNGTVKVKGDQETIKIVSDLLVLLSKGEGITRYGDSEKPMEVTPSKENGTTNVIFRREAVEDAEGNISYEGEFTGTAYVNFNGNVLFKDSVLKDNALADIKVSTGNVEFSNMEFRDNANMTLKILNKGNVSFDSIFVNGTHSTDKPKLDVSTVDGDIVSGDVSANAQSEILLTTKKGNIRTGNVSASEQSKILLTTKKGNIQTGNVSANAQSEILLKAENGDIRTDDVSLKDNAVLEVNATDGNVTVKKADVSSSGSSHASLFVTTRDKNQKKGNLTIGETLNAQGKVVLDLSGSLLGEIQKDGKEKTSTIILGEDVYHNDSSFSFGGDIGSREIPLVIDVTESNVPFKIVTVRNSFIRGAEHYRLTEDYNSEPKDKDGQINIRVDLDTEEISDALEAYKKLLESEDSSEEELEAARAAVEEALAKLAEEKKAEILEQLKKAAESGRPTGIPKDPVSMVVEIGTSTGTTDGINISNYGDITVIQKAGDLYIGRIETNRSDLTPGNIALGNVTVKALGGSIIGLNQNGTETEEIANITANNITLEAKKNISGLLTELIQKEYQVSDKILTGKDGEELEDPKLSFSMVKKNSETVDENGNPITVTVWEPEFTVSGYVDYTGNWVFDAKKEGILNASSEEGNIQIKEKEGNIGLGVITAPKGTVEIATDMDSDILDRRSEDQKEAGLVNITAGNGNSSLTGKRIGTETDPITVDIRGKLLVDAIEDIRLEAKNSLDAQTDSQTGKVYASAEKDLTLSSDKKSYGGTGDLYVEKPKAGGDLTLAAAGNLYTDELTAPGNVTAKAGGNITVDTVKAGKDATLEAGGDVLAETVKAGENASITAGGSILEGDRGDEPAAVTAKNITLIAGNEVGTRENPYEVDTSTDGTLTVKADSAVIREISGDLTLKQVETKKDFVLDADGSVYDGNGNLADKAADAKADVDKAQVKKDAAETDERVHEELILPPLRDKKDQAESAESEAEKAKDEAQNKSAELEQKIRDMENLQKDREKLIQKAVDAARDQLKKELEKKLSDTNQTLQDIEAEISELEAKEDPTPEETKRLEELKNSRDELNGQKSELRDQLQNLNDTEGSVEEMLNRIQDIQTKLEKGELTEAEAEELLKELLPAKELLESGDIEKLAKDLEAAREEFAKAEEARNAAEENYAKAHEEAEKARQEYAASEEELNQLKEKLRKAEEELKEAKAAYEEAKKKAEEETATVIAGGNLDIRSNGEVGKEDHGLSVKVDGTVEIKAEGDVSLTSPSDLTVDNINSSNGTGDVTIRVDGNLKDVPGKSPAVKAKRADLSAADGDIGTTDNPFSVSVSEVKASADNVYLENDRDLLVDEIHGKKEDGTVQIRVDGDRTGKTADSMISGGHLEAEINGSLGTPENRMNTDVDSIKAKADDIYLNNISDKMEIRGMTAENIDIIARGDIFGKDVRSGNLVIRSNGHTGYSDNPLLIHVSGNVDIGSTYGEVHYVNSYRAEKPSEEKPGQKQHHDSGEKPERKPSSQNEKEPGLSESEHGAAEISGAVKTGDSAPTEANLYLALLSMAAVILLLKEKRRKNR